VCGRRIDDQQKCHNFCCSKEAKSGANALSLLVCDCFQVNLMSYVKLSTYRDFRIQSYHLQTTDNEDQKVSVSYFLCVCVCVCCLFNAFCSINKINEPEISYIIF
jgi:hypothetical protein